MCQNGDWDKKMRKAVTAQYLRMNRQSLPLLAALAEPNRVFPLAIDEIDLAMNMAFSTSRHSFTAVCRN
jgi:hypothetical protein